MGILDKIFGAPKVAAEGAAGAVVDVAGGVADIVERWKPSEAARHEMYLQVNKLVQDAAQQARQYEPRTVGTRAFTEYTNVVVDAVSRLIRPAATILFLGALFGWWDVQTQSIDPFIVGGAEAILVFWFGARTIFKDIPTLIKAIREARSA